MEHRAKELTMSRLHLPNKLSSHRGMALFIVLAILVLVSALVIGFFSSMTTEVKSSRSYASGVSSKQLADSAVQLVIAQITDATKGKDGSNKLAWASQPGMIRTYDQSGNPAKYYKLYSSGPLIQDGTSFNVTAEAPPSDWSSQKGLFTDLNSPISRDGKMMFPILDGNAIKSLTLNESGKSVPAYLGYDSNGDGRPDIEGFSIDPASVTYNPSQPASPTNNPVPMPVKWLYILQNGKLATPISSANGTVSFDPTQAPSSGNPIVGRIAFWTDDESSKVNINTASEGVFWDRPWANTLTEQKFSTSIPAQNEFQRYPGHPAMTNLSTVLGSILPSLTPDDRKRYYDLIPRLEDGGTRGGTLDNTTSSFGPITPDADRLYSTVDEFFYNPSRTSNSAPLSNTFLQKARFFLTAHSRAPEINLFGKPRMTLWPIQAETTERNAKDRLIAFCSEIGGQPYYFQRATTYSAGSPSSSSSQSATMDWTRVGRNQELYSYLNTLTSQNVPGFGGNFQAKYSNTRQQLLTEMFDMIRSGVNSYSTSLTPKYSYTPSLGDPGEGQVIPLKPPGGTPGAGTQGFGRYATVSSAAIVFFRGNAANYTTTGNPPIIDTDPVTGKIKITPDAQIQAVLLLNTFTPSPGLPMWSPNVQYVVTGLDQFKINGTPMGFGSPLFNTVTSRLGFSGGGNAMPFLGLQASFRYADDIGKGMAGLDSTKALGFADPIRQYGLWSGSSGVTVTSPKFDFGGGTITITTYSATDTARTTPLQTIDMKFDDITGLDVPTTRPTLAGDNSNLDYRYYTRFQSDHSNTLPSTRRAYYRFMQSYTIPNEIPSGKLWSYPTALGKNASGNDVPYEVFDVVRGVEPDPAGPAKGDLRIYAGLGNVPASYFKPSPSYSNGDVRFTHALRDEAFQTGGGSFGYDVSRGGISPHYDVFFDGSVNTYGLPAIQDNSGFLVAQQYLGFNSSSGKNEYRAAASPAVPRGLAAALNSNNDPGDWDNMTGLTEDGPFINKPDEGNSATVSKLSGVSYLNRTITGGYFSSGLSQGEGSDYKAEDGETFSPNRQVASAVMFGSLPTGINPSSPNSVKPWQTLLFAPNSSAGASHPGRGLPVSGPPYTTPPDHLMLDLFTMPIVEPYAISEPFSTSGKVNMNYQIMPFSYLTRSSGVRAVLKSTQIMAIPSTASTKTSVNSYKDGSGNGYPYELRFGLNLDETGGTLRGFADRFAKGDIFRSASEICDIFLVPQKLAGKTYASSVTEPTYANMANWWNDFRITGDNAREFPYGTIYPRLTTKSNTYTVHYKVQTLKKLPSTSATQWVENKDQVTGEIRGSSTVERYIDLGNQSLPDFATDPSASAEDYYKIHIISSTTFSP